MSGLSLPRPLVSRLRNPLTRLERYVLGHTLGGVAGAAAVISTLIMLVNFVEISRSVGSRAKDITTVDIFVMTVLQSPSIILLLVPFAILFGVMAAYGNLNRRSELIAMRAAGVSAWRFTFPAALAAMGIGVATVLALNPIASAMNAEFQRRQSAVMDNYLGELNRPIWLRQGDGRTQVIIRARARAPGVGIRLLDVSLFRYAVRADGHLDFRQRVEAREAVLKSGQWLLSGARSAEPGSQSEQYGSYSLPSTLDERKALERFTAPSAVPFWSLPSVIERTERAGFSATAYRLQFDQLLATPLMFAGMSVLAAAFSLRLVRLGGLARLAASGAALGFVIFFLNQLCNSLGRADVIPAFFAALTPPLLALLSGFTLLCYTEDG
jgi:lipopolysaccharide export system permease protein